MQIFNLYILDSEKRDRYYVGITGNIADRINRHNSGRSKYTKSGIPWELVYTEEFPSKSLAMKREYEIKRIASRKYIEELIQSKKD